VRRLNGFGACLRAPRKWHGFGKKHRVTERCAVKKLDSALGLGRATYERWLGTEADEITAAANALRHFEPNHPSLVDLEVRLRRARHIKAMLADIIHRELASDDDEDWRRL